MGRPNTDACAIIVPSSCTANLTSRMITLPLDSLRIIRPSCKERVVLTSGLNKQVPIPSLRAAYVAPPPTCLPCCRADDRGDDNDALDVWGAGVRGGKWWEG
jgi:hypothetical protein